MPSPSHESPADTVTIPIPTNYLAVSVESIHSGGRQSTATAFSSASTRHAGQRRHSKLCLRSRNGSMHPRVRSNVQSINSAAKQHSGPEAKSSYMYSRHPFLLHFVDPQTEQRYYNFQYVDNAFIPGKMFAVVWTSVIAPSFILFTASFEGDATYMVESFKLTDKWWVVEYTCSALCLVLSVGLFVEALKPHRELIHLAQLLIGWPALIIVTLNLKQHYIYNYGFLFGCTGFSMLLVLPRWRRVWPCVTLWPIACLFAVTFATPGYWDHHTKLEMLYWLIFLTPVGIVVYVEKRLRHSFVLMEGATKATADIEHKTAVTQRVVANFFPPTPTRDLLRACRNRHSWLHSVHVSQRPARRDRHAHRHVQILRHNSKYFRS